MTLFIKDSVRGGCIFSLNHHLTCYKSFIEPHVNYTPIIPNQRPYVKVCVERAGSQRPEADPRLLHTDTPAPRGLLGSPVRGRELRIWGSAPRAEPASHGVARFGTSRPWLTAPPASRVFPRERATPPLPSISQLRWYLRGSSARCSSQHPALAPRSPGAPGRTSPEQALARCPAPGNSPPSASPLPTSTPSTPRPQERLPL